MDNNLDDQDRAMLAEYARILSTLPKSSAHILTTSPTYECVCGKHVPIEKLSFKDSGAVKFLNNVCTDCKSGNKHDRETARIICMRCKNVLMRIPPSKDPVTGFQFKANTTYHLPECILCHDGLKSANIIERTLWDRKLHDTR